MTPQGAGGQPKKRILVGMSGGTNSAVVAALLKSQGFQVIGVHIQVFDPKVSASARFGARCCLTKNADSAKEICRKLEIPFHLVDSAARFEEKVVDAFVHDLIQARQPSPCIPCNMSIRLETLLSKADELGCEQVATGHHAQIIRDAGGDHRARVHRGVDAKKDQTYFLFGLTQAQLTRLLFPLGGFQSSMIERLAREFELPQASSGEPQEMCFSSGEAHLPFVEARVPVELRPPGVIRMTEGGVMGEHRGLYAYRIGQKVKLAPHIREPEKYQVIDFDLSGRALIIGFEKESLHAQLRATGATWVRAMDGLRGLKTSARFSPGQKEAVPCRVTHFENSLIRVELEQPFKGIAVGQAVVFYDGDEVIGGAYVDSVGSLGKDD